MNGKRTKVGSIAIEAERKGMGRVRVTQKDGTKDKEAGIEGNHWQNPISGSLST